MELGELVRAYAWEVAPRQASGFEGGAVANLSTIGQPLNDAATRGKLDQGMPVTFIDARTNPFRDLLMTVGYGSPAKAESASTDLALRLAGVTDNRSKPCLLMVSVHQGPRAGNRRIVISTFPQDVVLQRRAGGVNLLEDVFSLTSRLRKAALVDGANDRTGYLKARVVDYETTSADRGAAEFWVAQFLSAAPEVDSKEGTGILGRVLKAAYGKVKDDVDALHQLNAAVAMLRSGPTRKRSLNSIANDLLDGAAEGAFRAAAGQGPETTAVFTVDAGKLEDMLQYRVFRLRNGVTVSAPFEVVGEDDGFDVQVTEEGGVRRVHAAGLVESESLRSRA